MDAIDIFLAVLRCVIFMCVSKNVSYALVKQTLKISKNVDHVEFMVVNRTFQSTSMMRCGVLCANHESFYYVKSARICHCNMNMVFQANSTTLTDIVLTQTEWKELSQPWTGTFRDCLDIYNEFERKDGVYRINPANDSFGVDVYCDMTNGGWTIIQRRINGEVDFYRNWDSYKSGFGNKSGEYWLGLEFIHMLTRTRNQLRIELETFGDVVPVSASAFYDFSIGDESSYYTLNVSHINSSCSDALAYHNGMPFSTFDADHGNAYMHCAEVYMGAWWYKSCYQSNLNGRYVIGSSIQFGAGIIWSGCWSQYHSLKSTTMKIKRLLP